MKKRISSILLALCMVLSMLPATALAEEGTTATTIDLAQGAYTIETDGEYVVSGYTGANTLTVKADATVTLSGVAITAGADASAVSIESGNVTLIVVGTNTLTGGDNGAGIYVAEGASVTIQGTGSLTAIGNAGTDDESGAAGIGGTYANGNSGAITIDGATVIAEGYGVHGSGIGSGSGKVVGEIKIINGANVTAQGGYYADGAGTKLQSKYGKSDPEGGAAIGGGGKTASTIADITITDSAVTAYGGSKAAGIGANFWCSCGTITIGGSSNVTVQGGSSSAGIGTSRAGDTGVTANIVISGGTVNATGGDYGAGIGGGYNADSVADLPEISIAISGGTVNATGGEGGAGIGGGYKTNNVNVAISDDAEINAEAGALVNDKTVATGGSACAIGSGANGSGTFEGSTITIAESVTVSVTAYEDGKPAIEGIENDELGTNVTLTEFANPAYVAQVGDKKFETLQAAVDAAVAGDTVMLLQDVTLTAIAHENPNGCIKVAESQNITLDLNGHTLATAENVNETGRAHVLLNYGTLTITDSANAKGAIVSNNTQGGTNAGGFAVYSAGSLALTDVVIEGNNIASYAVYVDGEDAVLTVDNTTVYGRGAIAVYNGAEATINSGNFSIDVATTNTRDNVVYVYDATATINGGTFDGTKAGSSQSAAVLADGASTVKINNGTFNAKTQDVHVRSTSTVNVFGGTFNTALYEKDNTATINLYGGTYRYDPADYVAVNYASGKSGTKWYVTPISDILVAEIDGVGYASLAEAVDAANTAGTATVTLLKDTTLSEKLTITGNVTIEGEYTITRDDAYTGTLFAVNAGATLTLDGGLTIDGGNNYTFDQDAYAADLKSYTQIAFADAAKYFTPVDGAPVATAYMITTSGTVNLNKVTVQNHYSHGSGIVSASTGATVNLTGAQITHCANVTGSGLVVNASSGKWDTTPVIWVNMNEGTVIDGNHVGGNHGVFKVYMGTVFTMNGGEIKNTTGWNSNGVVVGMYWATFNMNGGTICSNSSVYGPNNGRNAAVYVHNSSSFTMNDGSICHNIGAYGGLDLRTTDTNSAIINGGSIVNNESVVDSPYADVKGAATLTINGGTYTQDVTQWCPYGLAAVYYEDEGVWKIESDYVVEIQEALLEGKDVKLEKDIVVSGKYVVSIPAPTNGNGNYFNPGIFNVVGDRNVTFDLNGHTITYVGHEDIEYTANYYKPESGYVNSCTVAHGLFLTNNGGKLTIVDSSADQTGTVTVNGMASGVYAASPDSVITVEGGTWTNEGCETCGGTNLFLYASHGGELYIKDGTFSQTLDSNGDSYLIVEHGGEFKNAVIDYSLTKIEITGGTFVGMNPEEAWFCDQGNGQTWSETDVVAEGYDSLEITDNTWIVGIPSVVTIDYKNGQEKKVIETVTGAEITLETPERLGYEFKGWSDGANVYAGGDTYTVEGTVTLTAKWERIRTTGGSSEPTYKVSVESEGVTANRTYAAKGQTVTITVSPDAGYELTELYVIDKNGDEVELTYVGDGKYTFKMPASKVEVYATFVSDECDGTYADNCPSVVYVDVNTSLWYHEALDFVISEGIMNGTGNGTTFEPTSNLSRAMMWTMLARLNGVDTTGGTTWYEVGQQWAMTNGVSDGTNPNGNITREQMVTMLYRYVGSPAATGTLNGFVDAAAVSDWALDAMTWAVANGVITGNGVGLNPGGNASRAEVAQIFLNYFGK